MPPLGPINMASQSKAVINYLLRILKIDVQQRFLYGFS
jgi:hypothetical protein